ncbi:hypothetical protein [Aquimarina sp. MMG016]|uniref:hypothetical protein n=1 Tax=Aquimarina sp. MMG016 TaxID=2822690 RepID=UPI001B3A035E|nr:hypothetical protein [Aquimarina sp. MMG016]MBQ4820590.1 hypothetical protein [Aquimarina sp. MMG016]
MKKNILIIVLFLITIHLGYGQFWHHHHTHNRINNDGKTRGKLGSLIGTTAGRNASLGINNGALASAWTAQTSKLNLLYTRNHFDRRDNFVAQSAQSSALSLATSALSSYPGLPYMTFNKREYLNRLTLDKSVLLTLQLLDASTIASGKRQEVYRLRSELIREFSKNDRDARKIIFFSAAALAVTNYDQFAEIIRAMKAIEITF